MENQLQVKPKQMKVKEPKVNITDDTAYYNNYYLKNKDNYKIYADRAKEKVHTFDICKISTAFRHHKRHDRTERHLKNAATIGAIEL